MAETVRVVHYLNQFFGGLGGEEQSNLPVAVREGAVGPGRVVEAALGENGSVAATIIAGDNYFAEESEAALDTVNEALDRLAPDVVIAGPAFDAGRYGLACALMCRAARQRGIPAVTAMTPDNVGVTTYRRDLICVPTGSEVRELGDAIGKMARIGLKLARGEPLGPAAEEGYVPTGLRRPVARARSGAERAIEMAIGRATGAPVQSEVLLQFYESVPAPRPVRKLRDAKIALVCSGGLVPQGNPDALPSARAERYYRYPIGDLDEIPVGDFISVHGGFSTRWLNTKDPNYVVPLRSMRRLESEGVIGALHGEYYSTVGNQTAVSQARRMGAEIAAELGEAGVDGVLLVAT